MIKEKESITSPPKTAPSLDGFPVGFYKTFKGKIIFILYKLLQKMEKKKKNKKVAAQLASSFCMKLYNLDYQIKIRMMKI